MNKKISTNKAIKKIDQSKFNEGSDTIKNIRDRLIAKHGKAEVFQKISAIQRQHEITDLLSQRRKQLKINQIEIAEAMDISRNQVIRYEKHQQDPSLTKFLSLCEKLDIEISLKDKKTEKIVYHT